MARRHRRRSVARSAKKARKDAWVVESDEAVENATALITELALRAGLPVEEVAASLARLEKDGWVQRNRDGSMVLLSREEAERRAREGQRLRRIEEGRG